MTTDGVSPAVSDPFPNKVRIEFETPGHDLHAAWKDVEASLDAGWKASESWCVYGETIPKTWAWLCKQYGGAEQILSTARVLVVEADARADERRRIADAIAVRAVGFAREFRRAFGIGDAVPLPDEARAWSSAFAAAERIARGEQP